MKKKFSYVLYGLILMLMFVATSCERKIYKVTFEENGGTTVSDIEVPVNETVKLPENPTLEGHTFIAWYMDSSFTYKFDVNMKIEGNITLYAKWSINTYNISFETYGGTSIAPESFEFGEAIELPDSPVKTGYDFAGWYTDSSLTEEYNLTTMPAKDIKLYAAWDAIEYQVTFVSDGVEITESTQSVEFGKTATLPTEPTKTGYTFSGWYLDENAYDFTTTISGNVTLTAKWTINQYNLKFDKDNGEELVIDEYDYSSSISAIADPIKTGYVFLGWYENDSLFNFDNAKMPASDLTLKAKWEAGTYGIEYRRNNTSAIGNMANTAATYDQNVKIANNEYTLTGYTFIGWNTAADGTGTSFEEGQEVINLAEKDNFILYAQWQANTYTVTFNANGGMGNMSKQSFTYDEKNALTANTFSRDGYEFVGWSESADGVVVYGNEDTVVNLLTTGNKTLYAIWTANTYVVEFAANATEFTGSMGNQTFTYDKEENLTQNAFVRTGYTFTGWNTKADGTGDSYSNRESIKNLLTSGSMTLYAQWSVNSYSVTIYYNGESDSEKFLVTYGTLIETTEKASELEKQASFDKWYTYPGNEEFTFGTINMPASDLVIYATYKGQVTINFDTDGGTIVSPLLGYEGDAIVMPQEAPTKLGYKFTGWYSDSKWEDPFDFENTLMPEGGLTVYAGWTAHTYTVEFNSNGGTGEMAGQERAYNDNEALTANGFTREGYTFVGWKTSDDETYTDEEVVNLTSVDKATITLFAQWSANTYYIEFDKNSTVAEGSMEPFEMKVDTASTLKNNGYSYTGYKLVEWNTASDGSGKGFANGAKIEENLTLENEQTVTLYAIWAPISYTIVFNGTDVEVQSQTVAYNQEIALNSINSREGYNFLGWAETDGGSKKYDNNANVINLSSIDGAKVNLFAIWEQITYTVEFYNYKKDIIDTLTVNYNGKLTPSSYSAFASSYTRVGYTFNGWADSTNTIVLSGNEGTNSLVVTKNLELYANYTVNKYLAQFIINNKVVYEREQDYGTDLKFEDYLTYLDEKIAISSAFESNIENHYNILLGHHNKTTDYTSISDEYKMAIVAYQTYLQSQDVLNAIEVSKTYYSENTIEILVNQILTAIGSFDIPTIFDATPKLYSAIDTMTSDFVTDRKIFANNGDNPYKENSIFGGWVLGADTQYEEFLEGSPYLDKVPASTNKDSNVVRIKASWVELDPIVVNNEKNSLTITWDAINTSKYGENCSVEYRIYHHTSTENVLLDTVSENKYTLNTDPSIEPYYAPGTYQLFVIAVLNVLDAQGNSIATIVSKDPNTYTTVTVALKESNLQVDVEGDYYKKGEEDGIQTFYFFTDMTYEFSEQNQFTLTNYDGEPIDSSECVTISGSYNNVLVTGKEEGYFYFTNSKTPDVVYYAKVLPYISQFDLGSDLQQFNSTLSLSNNLYLDKSENTYQVGVNVVTKTTTLANNGFAFDLNVNTTGGKSIDYKQYKDYLVYKFELYNKNTGEYSEVVTTDWSNESKPWEQSIGTYNYETAAWNFLSSNSGNIYKVTISINDNYVPPILSDKKYGNDKVGKGLIKSKSFVIELNDGINVFSNDDFKKAFADTTLKGGLNIHKNITAELSSDQYYDFTDPNWSSNPLETYYSTSYNVEDSKKYLQGTPINVPTRRIFENIGNANAKSGNVYQRASKTDLNETYVINGNLFTIDGSNLGYTNIYSYGDLSPLADYKISDAKISIIGYFVTSNYQDITSTTNSKLVVNDLTIISNAGNIGQTQSGAQTSIEKLNLYSGGYHGLFVSNGSASEINNTVIKNSNVSVFVADGSSLEANYLHTMSSWYNSILNHTAGDMSFANCYLKDSGGAAIQVLDRLSTLEKPTETVITIYSTTKIENYVSGEEGYFKANSMEISVMQMKTQFDDTLKQATGSTHTLISTITDPVTNLSTQKINFAFLFMPCDENARGENGGAVTAFTTVKIHPDKAGGNQIGLMGSSGQYSYNDVDVAKDKYPALVGYDYSSTKSHYNHTYLIMGYEIPYGKCLFGSIGNIIE